MVAFFDSAIYYPIYNALVYVVSYVPYYDIGIAIIVITILVRIILYPFAKKAVQSQMAMKEIAPEIEKLKEKHKGDNEKQAKAIFGLYKERGVNPFASLPLLILQLPIMIGLYWVFAFGGFPAVNAAYLYSFVTAPAMVNMQFLGLIDMNGHSIVLAVLTAITQYGYARISMGKRDTTEVPPEEATLTKDLARSFDMQARYVLPVMMGVISYTLIAAAPLYLTVSNILMIAQEFASGRRWEA